MFVNILFFTFLSAFIVIVALGHVMLFAAIWPNLFTSHPSARQPKVELEPAVGAGGQIHQPN